MGDRWRCAAARRTSVSAGMSSQPVRRAGSIKSWVMDGDFLSSKTPPGAILSLQNAEIAWNPSGPVKPGHLICQFRAAKWSADFSRLLRSFLLVKSPHRNQMPYWESLAKPLDCVQPAAAFICQPAGRGWTHDFSKTFLLILFTLQPPLFWSISLLQASAFSITSSAAYLARSRLRHQSGSRLRAVHGLWRKIACNFK